MDKVKEYIEIGKKFGLDGSELKDYVNYREEKDTEREREREKEKMAREDRLLEREIKRMEIERLEKEKTLELSLLDKEIELEKAKKMDVIPSASVKKLSEVKAKLPKLPAFNEKQDSMDAYLRRFERFAENAEWGVDHWATHLSALLQGKALDVYSRLSVTDSLNYNSLKEALLQRFQLTEEGFRSKFRISKPEIGETPQQFVVRLEEYLLRWMGLAKVPETFDGLKDLVLREQFMQVSNKSLQIFLKEHKVKSVKEMTDLAQQYQEAHEISNRQTLYGRVNYTTTTDSSKPAKQTLSQPNERDRVCYNCRSSFHLIKDCPELKDKSKVKAGALSYIETNSFRGRGRFNGRSRGNRGGYRGGYNSRNNEKFGNQDMSQSERKDVANLVVENKLDSCCSENNAVTLVCGHKLPVMTVVSRDDREFNVARNMPVSLGIMNDQQVEVLRDSGCSGVIVRRSLVHADWLTGKSQMCVLVDGTVRKFPVARICVDTPFFTGQVEALCAERPVYDLIIGNILNVRDASDPDLSWKPSMHSGTNDLSDHVVEKDTGIEISEEFSGAVETRAQKAKVGNQKPLHVVNPISSVGTAEYRLAQETDSSLGKGKELAATGEKVKGKGDSEIWYSRESGLLYRNFSSPKIESGKWFKQLLVPVSMRNQVLKLAHDSILGGHLGVRKMSAKILAEFYWPGVQADVSRYCKSCDICQKTFAKGKVSKVPIGELPLIETPFERVAVDLIGPISPPSDKGHRFILTMVDYSTRYPEAVALKRIDTETVAESLVEMFTRVGFPKELLSDMGKQFTSNIMKEVGRLLSIKQLTTSPYNPACNGLVERFNGTLKSMLKKMCAEQPKQWDRFIAPLLFAYREAPQESTGFSPFELLYGRTVRGPLMILRELWTNEVSSDEVKTTYEYVLDLRNRLEETVKLAQVELSKNKARYKQYADRKRKPRCFEVGDKVLVLLPTDRNKLLMQLKGPYSVKEKVNDFDYKIIVNGKERVYHINLLRKYIERVEKSRDQFEENDSRAIGKGGVTDIETDDDNEIGNATQGIVDEVCVAVIEEFDEDIQKEEVSDSEDQNSSEEYCRRQMTVNLPSLIAKETIDDVKINPELTPKQNGELLDLLRQFPDVLTDLLGTTSLMEHDIVQKFQVFLYGLETDHQPLVYLNRSKVANARLMRWALALRMYRFRIVSIKGSENIAADFLSRHA